MKTRITVLILTFFTVSSYAQQDKFLSDSSAFGDSFGASVAVSKDGDVMVVGAPNDDEDGVNRGAVFVYIKTNTLNDWTLVNKLEAMDADDFDRFGVSVAVSRDGERIAVGAEFGNTSPASNGGAVYIFNRTAPNNWAELCKLTSPTPQVNARFGFDVALSHDATYLLVGEPRSNFNGRDDSGAAYFYTNTGGCYDFTETMRADTVREDAWFGYSVALDGQGNWALIGAPRENTGQFASGAVYNFENTNAPAWIQQDKFTQTPFVGSIEFGWDVAISDFQRRGIIGAPGLTFNFPGRAYVLDYDGNGLAVEQVLFDPSNIRGWGSSVAIDSAGLQMLVGDPLSNEVILFAENSDTMTINGIINGFDSGLSDNFGTAIALSTYGYFGIFGAPFHEVNNWDVGAAYGQDLRFICKEHHLFHAGNIPSGTYRANQTITASIPTQDSSIVIFSAGQEATLNPFFEVGVAGDLEIEIDGCDSGL